MSGEALTSQELFTVLEAARWAPSAKNAQPWRFLYVLPDSAWWPAYQALLEESHRQWMGRAGALVLILAKRTFDPGGQVSRAYSFDAGAACQNASLQAVLLGLVAHVVQSFDAEAMRWQMGISVDYSIEFMLVLGRPGDRTALSPALQAREVPTPRRGLGDIAFEGCLPESLNTVPRQ
jgi:nitroreductase